MSGSLQVKFLSSRFHFIAPSFMLWTSINISVDLRGAMSDRLFLTDGFVAMGSSLSHRSEVGIFDLFRGIFSKFKFAGVF